MKNKIIVLLLILVALGVLVGTFYAVRKKDYSYSLPTPAPVTDFSGEPAVLGSYTLEEVAVHKDAGSCWTIIRDSVYDLTPWIGQHPGGEQAILSICGKDGTQAFLNQHKGNQKQEDILAGFKIGTYKK